MSGHTRQALVPLGGPHSRKRKERDEEAAWKLAEPSRPKPPEAAEPGGNRLLAGYLAHEFLTRGTLLGKQWDQPPARSGSVAGPGEPPAGRTYEDVACLLRMDGAHIPGIVNPTQLAQWLRM